VLSDGWLALKPGIGFQHLLAIVDEEIAILVPRTDIAGIEPPSRTTGLFVRQVAIVGRDLRGCRSSFLSF
jgi:hypothetical protein